MEQLCSIPYRVKSVTDFTVIEMELIDSALEGDILSVQELLDKGIGPNIQNEYRDTALHYASYRGYIDMVKLLLERGADPNVQNNGGDTPLFLSSTGGYIGTSKLLILYRGTS